MENSVQGIKITLKRKEKNTKGNKFCCVDMVKGCDFAPDIIIKKILLEAMLTCPQTYI